MSVCRWLNNYHEWRCINLVAFRITCVLRPLRAQPVTATLHSDACRDINDSWETDERGFIAEDEEAICGLQGDQKWWAAKGLSFGVEGGNGALVAVGPVPGWSSIADYFWHGGSSLGTWRRIIAGSTQGLDNDISSLKPHGNGWSRLPRVYTDALVYSLQMTAEQLDGGGSRFSNGGNATHWPYPGGGFIMYRGNNGSVFLPAVLPPPAGSPKTSPTSISTNRVRVYSPSGGDEMWLLPPSWTGKTIHSSAITDSGTSSGPAIEVNGASISIKSMPANTPVVLTVI